MHHGPPPPPPYKGDHQQQWSHHWDDNEHGDHKECGHDHHHRHHDWQGHYHERGDHHHENDHREHKPVKSDAIVGIFNPNFKPPPTQNVVDKAVEQVTQTAEEKPVYDIDIRGDFQSVLRRKKRQTDENINIDFVQNDEESARPEERLENDEENAKDTDGELDTRFGGGFLSKGRNAIKTVVGDIIEDFVGHRHHHHRHHHDDDDNDEAKQVTVGRPQIENPQFGGYDPIPPTGVGRPQIVRPGQQQYPSQDVGRPKNVRPEYDPYASQDVGRPQIEIEIEIDDEYDGNKRPYPVDQSAINNPRPQIGHPQNQYGEYEPLRPLNPNVGRPQTVNHRPGQQFPIRGQVGQPQIYGSAQNEYGDVGAPFDNLQPGDSEGLTRQPNYDNNGELDGNIQIDNANIRQRPHNSESLSSKDVVPLPTSARPQIGQPQNQYGGNEPNPSLYSNAGVDRPQTVNHRPDQQFPMRSQSQTYRPSQNKNGDAVVPFGSLQPDERHREDFTRQPNNENDSNVDVNIQIDNADIRQRPHNSDDLNLKAVVPLQSDRHHEMGNAIRQRPHHVRHGGSNIDISVSTGGSDSDPFANYFGSEPNAESESFDHSRAHQPHGQYNSFGSDHESSFYKKEPEMYDGRPVFN